MKSASGHTPKLRKMLAHLAEATLARYERVKGGGRAHAPDFNAMMMRICASIVEERDKGVPPAERCDPLTPDERRRVDRLRGLAPPACCDEGPHTGKHGQGREPQRNMLGDRVVDDNEFVTAKGFAQRHDDGPTHADEDTNRMTVLDDGYDTEHGGDDGEP